MFDSDEASAVAVFWERDLDKFAEDFSRNRKSKLAMFILLRLVSTDRKFHIILPMFTILGKHHYHLCRLRLISLHYNLGYVALLTIAQTQLKLWFKISVKRTIVFQYIMNILIYQVHTLAGLFVFSQISPSLL